MPTPTLVKEESLGYTSHDQLFKQLINTFFEEFLEAFFPEIHRHMDFEAIQPYPQEVYTDFIQGRERRLDIIVETKLKGTESVIIIHIEPQNSKQDDFHERMFRYFSLLYNKYQKPVIPIAVFSYNQKWEQDTFKMDFPFFHVLTFHYLTLHLRKKNWREFIKTDNPAAAALLSKMGYHKKEKVQVKIEFLRMISRLKLDPARERLIYGFFDTYLTLSKKEEEEMMKEIDKLPDADKIMELPISYEERGIEKGKELGEEVGIKKVAREMLRKGLSIELIAEVTHLDEKEIKQLQESL